MKKFFATQGVMRFAAMMLAVAVLAGACFSVSPVYAQTGPSTPTAPTQAANALDPTKLEKAYQAELKGLGTLQKAVDHPKTLEIPKIQDQIIKQKAKGQNTANLEAALANFQSQLAQVQSSHDSAATILNAHSGFDANGKVTAAAQAAQTVRNARQALEGGRRVFKQSQNDLRKAALDFRLKDIRLPGELKLEQLQLNRMQKQLDRTTTTVTRLQDFMNKQKQAGKDITALENTLKTYQSQVTNARTAYDKAALILNKHAGFDDQGKVTDVAAARQTLQDGRQALVSGETVLRQGNRELAQAFAAWKKANPKV